MSKKAPPILYIWLHVCGYTSFTGDKNDIASHLNSGVRASLSRPTARDRDFRTGSNCAACSL
jgi:hypothetical protein